MKARAVLVLVLTTWVSLAIAQCPATDFTLPTTGCLGEQLPATNTSSPGSYSWDFCSGDFAQVPTAQLIGTLPGVNGRPGIEFAFDTKWYAFVTGTFSNVLYRLDFDNGLQAAPAAVTSLGSLSGALNQPGQIRLLRESGQWYGLLHNTSGELVKLSFGTQLSNTPSTSVLIAGVGYTNSGLAVSKDPTDGYICVLSNASNQFTIIRLGTTLTAPNPVTDVLTSAAVPNPNNLGDLDVIQVCGNWYGFAVNLGNANVYRLDFGASLFNSPAIAQVQTIPVTNPGRLRVVQEGDRYYSLVLALDGTLTKADFGSSITSVPSLTNEGNLGGVLTANMYGLGMVKENSTWTVIGVNLANGQYFRINYADNCSASPSTSILSAPTTTYSSAGTYQVTLYNTTGAGVGVHTQQVSISSAIAPDIDFTTMNNCAQNTVQFNSINGSGNLVSYSWDFGDGQTSATPNPGNVYTSAGNYVPNLIVTASNGCTNQAAKPLAIFNVPAADFLLPAVSPVCTNQSYNFDNTSSLDPGSNPSWEWRVNGVLVSSQPDLQTSFANPVSQEVRLKAIIPGCEQETIKNIGSVLVGPVINFTLGNDCAGNTVSVTNSSTGVDAGFQWDFGDGGTSTQSVPGYSYVAPGDYTVTLTGSNSGGCNNQLSQPVKIYSVPQPDFSVGLPPFSCSNAPTLFQNVTPPLTDSNIAVWSWSFGDPLSSTSTQRDASFTYVAGGDYDVGLTATSDQGCSKTFNKLVTIGTSPVADFVFGAACVNQPTQFTDISSGGVQSRTWQIGPASFNTTTPSYTFGASGSYSASLTVVAPGGCSNMVTKPVDVPPVPVLTLDVQNPCVGQPATFNLFDATVPPAADAIVNWQWNIAGSPASGNPATETISLTGPTPVSVTTTHASGCSYTKVSSVTIHPAPVASFVATPDRGDPPLTVQFQNASTGADQYSWIFSGAIPGLSTQESPLYTFLELGDYTATLRATNGFGCVDEYVMPIMVLNSSIDLSLTSFMLSPDAATGKLKSTVSIRNSSNIPIATAEVALHLSEQAVVSESVPINLLPGETTVKTLAFSIDANQLKGGFVCAELVSESDVQQDNNRQCISLRDEDFVFDPYPNPSPGMVELDWVSSKGGSARITVFNSQGRREYEWETTAVPGLNQTIHDFTGLAAGAYLVTIQTSSTFQTRRFIRQ